MTSYRPVVAEVDFDVFRESDWNDSFQLTEVDDLTTPVDLTDAILELNIRPSFAFATPLIFLTSVGDAGIIIDADPTLGIFSILVPRPTLRPLMPVGLWKHHLTRKTPAADEDGYLIDTIWRGEIKVLPGEFSTS